MEASFGIEGMTATGPKECPRADDLGSAFHLLFHALDGVGGVQLGLVLAGEGHAGEDVVLAGVHDVGELGPSGTKLLGHLAPGFPCMGAVGLVEGLPDGSGDDGVLAARE